MKTKPPFGSKPPEHRLCDCNPKTNVQKNLDEKIKGCYLNEDKFDLFCSIVAGVFVRGVILVLILFIYTMFISQR